MSAGFKYDLTPVVEQEERYDVQTGIRRRGPYKLDTTNLVVGSFLPGFTPIYADLKNKFAYAVINVKVIEAYTNGAYALSIKIAKNSLAYVGMFIGNGKKGAEVTAIDKSNASYDVLTIKAAFGEDIAKDTVLFQAIAADGTKQKYVANSALYNRTKVEDGIVLVSLLRTAAEIEPSKLVMPFSENDKANLKGWFEFNE
ncbi:head fiber protein [uncultured Parabacteroides sp.]|uniref:head fiber protein n=1 Tax=uncultured Parabacteroides sp. TaxID=512312 RepID=UPI002659AD48|nr:head fiber protein [uncultured Parabacteroides sp.]